MRKRRTPQTDHMKNRARRLRRDSTFPERLLWSRLRGRRLAGLKFRRQHPVGRFIVDFYCDEHRLAVELDGQSHNDRAAHDAARSAWLEQQGVRVLRFHNDDVLEDVEPVLAAIAKAAGIDVFDPETQPPSPQPSPKGKGSHRS